MKWNVPVLCLAASLLFSPCLSLGQPCPENVTTKSGGCPDAFGAPQGGVFEFNESFLTEAIRNAWDANGFGSPRGDYFLGDPTTGADDNLDLYVLTEPFAVKWNFAETSSDDRRLPWVNRIPGKWDDLGNADSNTYPTPSNFNWDCGGITPCYSEYNHFPFGDDENAGPSILPLVPFGRSTPQGGYHTFAAESCPAGFFDGLDETERTAVQTLSDVELEALLEGLEGWPTAAEVNDPETGMGPDAYTLLMKFAKELERTPHNQYNRYTFLHPGPNWLRMLSPIAVIKNADLPDEDPVLELRFPLFGVYNPLGCAQWYYQEPGSRTLQNALDNPSDNDIKVSWAVLVLRASLELNIAADPPVLEIIMDPTDDESVEFMEGNVRDGDELMGRIRSLTVDPDWLAAGNTADEWHNAMQEIFNQRHERFFERLADLLTVGIAIINVQELLVIPLDPLLDNYENMTAGLADLGISLTSIGLLPNPLETMQFKMWEEQGPSGNHQDGICAIGMDFLMPVDPVRWEVAEYNFIPTGKQFALTISNYLLNAVLPPFADSLDVPGYGGPEEDRCGNYNWVDLFQLSDLDLRVPVGSGDGAIQLSRVEAELGLRIPWWLYLIAAALVAAAVIWVVVTWGLSPSAWACLAIALTLLAAVIDLDINKYAFHSEYAADGSVARFFITHENSLPQLSGEIDLGMIHPEETWSILTTIVNPFVGIFASLIPDWIGVAIDDPIPIDDILLTAFRFSLNVSDTTLRDWLQNLQRDYKENGCSPGNQSSACEAVRTEWRTREDYRQQVTFLKTNYLDHNDWEMILGGQFCLPPDFYDLEQVFEWCNADDKPRSTAIDRCANFYEDGLGDRDLCEDFVAICNNCTEALGTGGDTTETITEALTVSDEERDELIAGIFDLWTIVMDCDSTYWDFLGNVIVQRIAGIPGDAFDAAQRALVCLPYGTYTPPPDCVVNEQYKERMELLDDLYNQADDDAGLSEASEDKLLELSKNVVDDALTHGGTQDDFGLAEKLGDIINVIKKTEECPDAKGDLPERDQGVLWDHPWEDPDLDMDGYPRFTTVSALYDCNDFDPDVSPGATEICNGKDDNCDEKVDEGFDGDGDGVTICADPPDCDDTNPFISPDMAELCRNLVDDDCDGVRDEADCLDCVDQDEDGFSPVGGFCGRVDCNDTDATVHPGAKETPDDGIDSNCNGNDDCFIATAAFGSPLDTHIDVLRDFRDQVLIPNSLGRRMVTCYYKLSPPIANFIGKSELLKHITRLFLMPVISVASLMVEKDV